MFSSIIERFNEKRDGAREAGVDAGFTLIELMVVLLIMAILLAIAIPTFLGVSGSANDRAAQSNLNTALTNVKSFYDSNGQNFGTDGGANAVAQLTTQEPSLKWVQGVAGTPPTGSSTSSGIISLYAFTDGGSVVLASYSKPTNHCWYIVDNEAGGGESGAPTGAQGQGTYYGEASVATGDVCNADAVISGATFQGGSSGSQGFPSP